MSTEERLAELTERLERGIRELYDSGQYAAYLSAMSKFHHYSFANALLILLQSVKGKPPQAAVLRTLDGQPRLCRK